MLRRVHTTLLASMWHTMPFSARALKKTISWTLILWYCGLYSYRQWVCVITLFPNIFSYICFCMLSEFAKVFERKVWHIRVSHLHNAIHNARHALSSPSGGFQLSTNLDKDFFHYLWYCGKKHIKCGLAWSVLLSTIIRIITVVKICCGLVSQHIPTTVMTRIIVDEYRPR